MPSKFGAIQQQLEEASGRSRPQLVADTPAPAIAPRKAAAKPQPVAKPTRAPSREGKKHIGAWLNADFEKSLLMVRASTGAKTHELIALALNDLFRAHKVPVVDAD